MNIKNTFLSTFSYAGHYDHLESINLGKQNKKILSTVNQQEEKWQSVTKRQGQNKAAFSH